MKIIYATDHHIKGRNPGSRLDDYPAAAHRKMLELYEVCAYEQPDALVLGGDFYDTPRVSFSLIIQYARILRKIKRLGVPIYLVPGNHDLYGYSMDTIDQTAIGVLAEAGLVKLLTRQKSFLLTDSKGVTVEIFGREYDKDIDLLPLNDYEIDPKHNARWNMLFSHGMLLKDAFHPDVRHSLTKDIRTQAHLIANGHYHDGYPIHEENGTIFLNPGSTGRDEICKRMPQYAIIEANKKRIKVDYVQYASAADYNDIFDFSVKLAAKKHERYLEAFEQTIQDAMDFDAYDAKDVLANLAKSGKIDQTILDAALDAIVDAEKVSQDNKLDGYVEKKFPIAITKVEIENFQSHAKTTVEFNQTGLNAITGASDSGKSAIIRALRWAFYNEPKGSEFIRHGESRATVTVHFSDGSSLTRTRTHSDAGSYIVRDPAGNEREFKGFANAIPIDVANTHQMPRVELSPGLERPLNFSYQLDGHFLLSESAGVRAATIGRLTGVHIVDAAIKEKRKELTNLTKDINAAIKRVEELDERIAGYDDLTHTKGIIDLATILVNAADALEQEIDELNQAGADIQEADDQVQKIEDQLKLYADVPQAEKLLLTAERIGEELHDLYDLAGDISDANKAIKRYTEQLQQYDRLTYAEQDVLKLEDMVAEFRELQDIYSDVVEAEGAISMYERKLKATGDVDRANEMIHEADILLADLRELQQLHHELSTIDNEIAMYEKNIAFQKEKEASARAKMKAMFAKMGNKCPTCQQDLDEAHMEHVVDAV